VWSEKILPQLIKLTADVGKVIMSFYKADMAVEMKLNKTPLTIAETKDQTIMSRLL
jgi:3'-phosphoadenosine 5'-phosphosulfate (PAPS) 3'-phosphatase